tara:strand:- start:1274 stop:1705 length:432 start_codon:yes stop_codon:yes gene_type:complete
MPKKRSSRKPENKTIPELIKRLDKSFAKLVKISASEDGMYVCCYTCGKSMTLGQATTQAGHFISRSYSPTRYDPNNVKPQCAHCNDKRYGNGKPLEFEHNLRSELGDTIIDNMKKKARAHHKWDRFWLIARIEDVEERLKGMA